MESPLGRALSIAMPLCVALACSSAAQPSGTTLTVTAAAPAVLADGTSTVVIHVDGTASGSVIVFTSRGTFDDGTTTATLDALPADVTLHTCDATKNAACAGYVRVQAGDGKTATGAVSLAFTAPAGAGAGTGTGTGTGSSGGTTGTAGAGSMSLASAQYQVQGVRSSGFQEANQLTFQLFDTAGVPSPAGEAVSFTHQSLGGSYIGPTSNCTAAVPSICTASGVTDASGKATVLLTSGREAGVVSVKATANAGTVSFTASSLAIIGAKASGAHITVDCTPRNVAALSDNDCNFSHYTGAGKNVTCTASLADRFNNVLGVSTLVSFASEAGSVGPPAATLQYDSTKLPTDQTGLGVAADFITVTGGKLPMDVAPFTGETKADYANACGTLTHNSRDGLVTVIAMVNGEEGYVDLNGNGQYDAGEPYIDMGEPYLDVNDNGKWDPGEPFVDVNKNGVYDGPNGKWDADTVIWAETRILYSGMAQAGQLTVGNEAFSRFYDAFAPPAPTAAVSFGTLGTPIKGATTGPDSKVFGLAFMDENLNPISSIATYAIAPAGTGVSAAFTVAPVQQLAWDGTSGALGMTFTQQYCDKEALNKPTKCSNVCTTAPCFVVTNVGGCDLFDSGLPGWTPRSNCTGFGYLTAGAAKVTGACAKAGADAVKATSTLNNITTTVTLPVYCVP